MTIEEAIHAEILKIPGIIQSENQNLLLKTLWLKYDRTWKAESILRRARQIRTYGKGNQNPVQAVEVGKKVSRNEQKVAGFGMPPQIGKDRSLNQSAPKRRSTQPTVTIRLYRTLQESS